MTTLEQLVDIIRAHRFGYADEDELQRGVAAALSSRGLSVEREVRLDSRNRVDLLVDRVGIEVKVKVGGSSAAVRRQVTRYAESDRLDAVLVVTSRLRHLQLPGEIAGKPVRTVSVGVL
jgi:hypothetical protein